MTECTVPECRTDFFAKGADAAAFFSRKRPWRAPRRRFLYRSSSRVKPSIGCPTAETVERRLGYNQLFPLLVRSHVKAQYSRSIGWENFMQRLLKIVGLASAALGLSLGGALAG